MMVLSPTFWLYMSAGLAVIGGLRLITPAYAAPASIVQRQLVTQVSPSQIASYKTSSYYASAGYCKPNATLSWKCGANCNANPRFIPTASGGDGVVMQFCELSLDM